MRTFSTFFLATGLTFASLAALLGVAFAAPATARAQPLLTPAELASLTSSTTSSSTTLRVIDIRPLAAYRAGHIPGAVSAPYAAWRGPASNPGKLPPIADLAHLVGSLGVSPTTHAVVVSSGADRSDFGASARVYWTLAYLGVANLSILNGGMQAWTAAGRAETKDLSTVAPVAFVPHLDSAIIAPTAAVAREIGNSDTLLLDARPLSYFLGEQKAPSAAKPGTIKGAVNFAYSNWFAPGTTTFVAPDRARAIAAHLKAEHPAKETIAFCNTGHWASIDWFALSVIAGEKDVRLYPQSLGGWTKDPALPMANVPSRASELWNDVKGVFAGQN